MDPRTGKPVFEEARRRAILGLPEAERPEAEKDASFRIAPLGSGSDYTPFLQHLTLSALNVGFGGESPGGVYHSAYDTVKWYQTYSDGDYSYGRTLSQITGTLDPPALRSAGAAVPVRRHRRHAAALRRRAREARRDQEGFEGRHEAGAECRGSVAVRRPRIREGLWRRAEGERGAAARAQGAAGIEQAAADVRAEAGQHRGPAAPRVVQAPDVRAGLLHRLRRQDDAADPRGARGEPLHRGAGRRAHGVVPRSMRLRGKSTTPPAPSSKSSSNARGGSEALWPGRTS